MKFLAKNGVSFDPSHYSERFSVIEPRRNCPTPCKNYPPPPPNSPNLFDVNELRLTGTYKCRVPTRISCICLLHSFRLYDSHRCKVPCHTYTCLICPCWSEIRKCTGLSHTYIYSLYFCCRSYRSLEIDIMRWEISCWMWILSCFVRSTWCEAGVLWAGKFIRPRASCLREKKCFAPRSIKK